MTCSECVGGGGVMPQLELGVLPLKRNRELVEGMKVAFFVVFPGNKGRRTKKTYIHIGRIVSVEDQNVVIEDIVAPISRFNRPIDKIFEVHKDTSLGMWAI